MGCKRVLLSDDYWPALTRDNVTLVTAGIAQVTPDGIRTADGTEHPVDTIIMGTGFRVTDPPIARRVHGRDGRSLAEAFTPTMRAYAGTAVPGFPNFFMLLGPNTGLGHTSVVLMIENQLRYVLGALAHRRQHGLAAVEPTPAAERRFVADVDARMRGTVWTTGGCRSWYLDAGGRNSTLWPGFVTAFRLRTARFRPADHHVVPPRSVPAGGDPTTEWIGASR
jgi:cation diffusion facilitator CzcD-associated flavoprotein CzcO